MSSPSAEADDRSRSTRPAGWLVPGVAGAVVGGVAVVAAWAMSGSESGSGSGGGFDSDGSPIAAPASVGDFSRMADIAIFQDDEAAETVERIQSWNAQSAARLSDAFGGAGSAIETYGDDEYETVFSVKLVRATSPYPPFVPYQDPDVLGIARPQDEVQEYGEVACVVHSLQTTPAGEEPDPESIGTTSCLRTGLGLTVEIYGVTGDLTHNPEEVAGLVDEVWATVD